MDPLTAKVDRKGRIVIPAEVRREVGLSKRVRVKVEKGRVVLEPIEDPLKSLEKIVVKGTSNVERDIRRLRRAAECKLLEA
ncbi:AbrB/MazE/SpoVT family DNA-binding domain-containing protein [Candidatus Hecatella orcuttiae]|uniref:AbrB/MazE/SpoVT family DNA-binding domain-containing protein n=1 Tax=Candidatus Hecatella orcuttiae TaxID=1935119 RepID=UPI002867BC86|nr:AbrB/MazE/SpoVT family DNA-binding domain-containing protein [Candidatus Hecatella orcuttiae]